MSITVEMSAPYLGLTHLVSAMALGVMRAQRSADELQNPEEMQAAAAVTCESKLRDLAGRRAIKGHDWETDETKDWQHLNIERDVFFVDDLNDCEELTSAGFRFAVVESELDTTDFHIGFEEAINNEDGIDWDYWVWKMPLLSSGEAARLMAALDPDIYKDLETSPNKNNTSKARKRALNIERLAEREGRSRDTPFNWLLWAKEQGFEVHLGYSREVNNKKEYEDALQALRELPPKEAAYWDNAEPRDEGRRQTTFAFAGLRSTQHFTLEQFVEEVSGRLARWQDGLYGVVEAAQVLADSTPGTDAESLCEQMEHAMHAGTLVLRKNDIPIPAADIPRGRLWNRFVRAEDVNEWLTASRARYQLTYPYAGLAASEKPEERRVSEDDWKQMAQQYAREFVKQQRARDLFPNQNDLGDHVARRFRTEGIVGADGKPLRGATIKRHGLKGISSAIGKQLSTANSRGK